VGYIARILAARAARSMRGGGGAMESGLSLVAGAVCVVIVIFGVVCVIVVVLSSLLRGGEWFKGLIARMLAARAARSMRGGGGARERGISLVAGAGGVVIVVVDGVCIIVINMSSLLHCWMWFGWLWGLIAQMLAARAARSMRGGGGARESGVFFVGSVGVGDFVVVVVVSLGFVMSLLRFGGFIARILAARAARSMRSGGGARESEVTLFIGLGGMNNDGRSVIVVSWSMKCRPLRISTVFGTLLLVPYCCGGRRKEASGCLLSNSSSGLSFLKGRVRGCSSGRGGSLSSTATAMVRLSWIGIST